MTPPNRYLTLSLRRLGFDTFQTNLLAIPPSALQILTMLGLSYSSETFGELTFHGLFGQIWAIPFLIYLVVPEVHATSKWII